MVLTDRKICSEQLAMGPTNVPFLEQFKTHDDSSIMVNFFCLLFSGMAHQNHFHAKFYFILFIYLFTYFRGEGEVDKSFFVKDTPKPFDDF